LAALAAVVSVSLSGLAGVASAAVPGTRLWVTRYDGPGNGADSAWSLAVSPDGTKVFVTGSSTGSTSGSGYATFAYSASTGARLWAARYDGPGDGEDVADSVAVSPGGTKVFVTGGSAGDYATVAYKAFTGAKLWAARYNGPGNRADSAWSLAVSPDGAKVFVTGHSVGSTSKDDYATIAYKAATGAKLWATRYNGPANDNDGATSVAVSPNGTKVFVTGSSSTPTSATDYLTFAYSASTGARLWAARYDGPGNWYDGAYSVAVSPAGTRVFVTGWVWGNEEDYATIAYAA
jgi:WD40 repeat protein